MTALTVVDANMQRQQAPLSAWVHAPSPSGRSPTREGNSRVDGSAADVHRAADSAPLFVRRFLSGARRALWADFRRLLREARTRGSDFSPTLVAEKPDVTVEGNGLQRGQSGARTQMGSGDPPPDHSSATTPTAPNKPVAVMRWCTTHAVAAVFPAWQNQRNKAPAELQGKKMGAGVRRRPPGTFPIFVK